MGDRVSKEEVEKASEVHILDYLNSKGESITKLGKYFRHADHDSLIINENGKWFWNSRGKGGHGAISFARTFYDMSFQNAVRDVNGQSITKNYTNDLSDSNDKQFSYPEHFEVNTHENLINYLVNERALDPKIVEALIKRDLIVEDKMKNCIFKWKNSDGDIVGADRQGTAKMENKRGSFKGIMANSKEDGGFSLDIGTPNKIALFESPIDAMSYFDMNRPGNIRLQSMSGLKDQTATESIRILIKECHERAQTVEKIIFAVDNDKAGLEFIKRWENVISNADIHLPEGKDWNDDLKNMKSKEKEKPKIMQINKQDIGIER